MYIYIYINLFFFRFFSIIGYYKILNIVPCASSRSLLFIYFKYSSLHLLIPSSKFIPPRPRSGFFAVCLFCFVFVI